ncbi:MAG: hypothetical protein ACM65L_20200 [Microcoleus sp.]
MANIFVGAKHDRYKSLVITNKLSAVMLRPCQIGMLKNPPQPPPRGEILGEVTPPRGEILGEEPGASVFGKYIRRGEA